MIPIKPYQKWNVIELSLISVRVKTLSQREMLIKVYVIRAAKVKNKLSLKPGAFKSTSAF